MSRRHPRSCPREDGDNYMINYLIHRTVHKMQYCVYTSTLHSADIHRLRYSCTVVRPKPPYPYGEAVTTLPPPWIIAPADRSDCSPELQKQAVAVRLPPLPKRKFAHLGSCAFPLATEESRSTPKYTTDRAPETMRRLRVRIPRLTPEHDGIPSFSLMGARH